MRVLVAMSGGVDSSVAAALARDEGHEVVGATMKLWGGAGDSGCCSVADVTDARRVCDALGIDHRIFNFSDDFETHVVDPYVAAHAAGSTPNPCVECNRHLKFDRLLARAAHLGFDAVATGHHARVELRDDGHVALRRGRDRAKDQSYVLSMLTQRELSRVLFPVGTMTKDTVRSIARDRGLVTAGKPDSQEVCFIASRTPGEGRGPFLSSRIALHPGEIVDVDTGAVVGRAPAVELVTVGQRRGLNVAGGSRRYAIDVDVPARRVLVGSRDALFVRAVALARRIWVDAEVPVGTAVLAQGSAHGDVRRATVTEDGIVYDQPERRIAPGQTVALYVGDDVIGSGVAR